jgi:hypothetical protein
MSALREKLEAGNVAGSVFDKRGIPLATGDIVKIYHFTAHRYCKRHYMYKQVTGVKWIGKNADVPYIVFSHLDLTDKYFLEAPDGRVRDDWEIVQSANSDHEDRPRAALGDAE